MMENRILRSDVADGSSKESTVVLGDSGAMSGQTFGVRANASGVTLTNDDSGKQISVEIGGGGDEVFLPASPNAGAYYDFVCLAAADPITVHARGLQVIWVNGNASSQGGSVFCEAAGSRLQLTYSAANTWIALASGPWTVSP